jgi:uncharacterized membrane protein YdjX (TVP38/TMEM64 family)
MIEPTPSASRPGHAFWGRLALATVLVLTFVLLLILGRDHFTWEAFQENRSRLERVVAEHRLLAAVLFFLLYAALTGLSVPGAVPLTLAAGALFDRLLGTVLVSFASTTGATLAFLSSRYLLRDWVQDRFGPRLEPILQGVDRDGAYYLFTLRLVVVPFFLINLAMGLTRMRVGTYWWVSQVGMLPATVLYVNAGAELAAIESPRDILSPTLIVSLALLGLAPLALRQAVQWWSHRRAAK